MVDSVSFSGTYAPLPLKFEAGTPNFVAAACLNLPWNSLLQLEMMQVRECERRIVTAMVGELQQIEG